MTQRAFTTYFIPIDSPVIVIEKCSTSSVDSSFLLLDDRFFVPLPLLLDDSPGHLMYSEKLHLKF